MDSLIIFLIIAVIIAIAAGTVVLNVIRAIRSIKRAAGSQAVQLAGKLAEELLSGNAGDLPLDITSRQPRSISDMTSVYAPAIARDFPDLNLKQLISSAENKLYSALVAVMKGTAGSDPQPGSFEDFSGDDTVSGEENNEHLFLGATPDFAAQIQRQTDALNAEDRAEYFERIKVHKTGIYSYQKTAGTCVLTLQTAIEYLHYVKQNGVVVSGSQQVPEQARYNIILFYVQDTSRLASSATSAVGVTCPNCGAAVRGLGQRQCEYCGTALQAIDIRIWRINQFIQS